MTPLDDPFALALKEIEALRAKARIIFVDFHAEATSEKVAMGWHLDGRVTAVAGTHTHVQTADERLLPKGTAYITDAGHDRPARFDHRRHRSRRRSAGSSPGMPSKFEAAIGRRPAERGHRHRRPGDREGDRDRARQPVGRRGRDARRYAGSGRAPLTGFPGPVSR